MFKELIKVIKLRDCIADNLDCILAYGMTRKEYNEKYKNIKEVIERSKSIP